MRMILWIAAAGCLLAAGYALNVALYHTWAASFPAAPDPEVQGRWAGRFFGLCFLLCCAAAGLIVMAVSRNKQKERKEGKEENKVH